MIPYYETELGKLYHGDCLEIMPHLEKMDLVLTDPPYNVGKAYGPNTNDRMPETEYWIWLRARIELISRILLDGYLLISHSDKGIYQQKPIIEEFEFEFVQHLIWWGKNGYSPQLQTKGWSFRHEIFQVFRKGKYLDLVVNEPGVPFTTVFNVLRPQSNFKEGRFHPTQKPILLYFQILQRIPGNLILDPFLGVGTTGIACERLNRRWIGIEIEEKYCEIAAQRIEQEARQGKLF